MISGERPIGAAKGKQSDTGALCQPPPPSVQRMPWPTNTSARTVLFWGLIHWLPGLSTEFMRYRTVCPTNTPVRTVFLRISLFAAHVGGGGGGGGTRCSFTSQTTGLEQEGSERDQTECDISSATAPLPKRPLRRARPGGAARQQRAAQGEGVVPALRALPDYFLAAGGVSCTTACASRGKVCNVAALQAVASSLATCRRALEHLGKTPQKGGEVSDDNSGCTFHPGQTGWVHIMRKDADPSCDEVNPDTSRQRVCACSHGIPGPVLTGVVAGFLLPPPPPPPSPLPSGPLLH